MTPISRPKGDKKRADRRPVSTAAPIRSSFASVGLEDIAQVYIHGILPQPLQIVELPGLIHKQVDHNAGEVHPYLFN